MNRLHTATLILACSAAGLSAGGSLRAPAYPLVMVDPYTNIWSMTDTLYADHTRHWTDAPHPMLGVLTVDGTDYRFMGRDFEDMKMLAPTSEWGEWNGRYTLARPDGDWTAAGYDDSAWPSGESAFASTMSGGRHVMIRGEWCRLGGNTLWPSRDIWVRRAVDIPADALDKEVYLEYSHNDGAEIYVNGSMLVDTGNRTADHAVERVPSSLLQAGRNIIAAHCHNSVEEGYIDFGLMTRTPRPERYTLTARQTSVALSATQTRYTFDCGPVELELTFTAPFLPGSLELASRPINYITYKIRQRDGRSHSVDLRLEVSPLLAVDYPGQPTVESITETDGLTLAASGTTTQRILDKWGDDRRIDWGYVYLGVESRGSQVDVADGHISLLRRLGDVGRAEGMVMLGYDDIRSIRYLGTDLPPYWNRDGRSSMAAQMRLAADEYPRLMRECADFDSRLHADAAAAGGEEYADLCDLAWRQTFAAHKLVESPSGEPLYLSKENFSNGSIGTVDLSYPSVPVFLLYNVELAKALMNPIFEYCSSPAWGKPFAAHDVGRYPIANGQNYGGDMPVEESGNMLIMAAAIARAEGNADYARRHWPLLTRWAQYLEEHGLDPENQLCTDDFAGHFAHNTNLSVKAILGLAAYGYLAGMAGDDATGKAYTAKARSMAGDWMRMADDGDHYRLTFDKPGTWSQKYNLVWDRVMGWEIFPPEVAAKELAYYLTRMNRYGLPLDSRETYTKTDWIMWSAAMAERQADFRALIEPVWMFMHQTHDRAPMADWIWTDRPCSQAFRNRSVVGAYFMRLLDSKLND